MCPNRASDVVAQIFEADVDEGVMWAMSARERRFVLYHLLDEDRASVDRLADAVAGWMAATDTSVGDRPDQQSLEQTLYHNHLPRLADAGLVEFDPDERVVTSESLSEPVRDLVQVTYMAEHQTDDPTDR